MTKEQIELEPCPFCGGEVELEQTIDGRMWWGIVCRNTKNLGSCAIHIQPSASPEAAIQRWNTRPVEQSLSSRIAELQEKNKALEEIIAGDATLVIDYEQLQINALKARIDELEGALEEYREAFNASHDTVRTKHTANYGAFNKLMEALQGKEG